MDREYYSRGERKSVEVLDDVVAIKVAPDDRGLAPGAESFGTEALAADVGIPRETIEAFQNANWLIVEPAPDVSRSLDAERAWRVPRTSGWLSGATMAPLALPPSD